MRQHESAPHGPAHHKNNPRCKTHAASLHRGVQVSVRMAVLLSYSVYDSRVTVSCLWGISPGGFVFCVCKCLATVKVNTCQHPPSPWFGDAEQDGYEGCDSKAEY